MTARTYAENRPYLLPDTLGELVGPVAGVVQLPLRLDWSERAEFHLDDRAERNALVSQRDGSPPGVASALPPGPCPAELGGAFP